MDKIKSNSSYSAYWFMMHLLLYFSLSFLFPACGSSSIHKVEHEQLLPAYESGQVISDPDKKGFPYQLDAPADRWKLPYYLREVSGLAHVEKETFAMIQDEKARLYLMDLSQNAITRMHTFGGSGDFEGVAIHEKSAFALRSDGTIYQIPDYFDIEKEAIRFKTPLNVDNDTEGLCLLPDKKNLLVVCKDESGLRGDNQKSKRGIYKFNVKKRTLEEEPYLLVDLKKVKAFLEDRAETKKEKEFAEEFKSGSHSAFQPSGIAIHPMTKDHYVIASVGKLLIVFDSHKKLKFVQRLNKEIFRQPEGVAFDKQGNLYIANEGKKGSGYILKFQYGG